jgi:hypothetical protein
MKYLFYFTILHSIKSAPQINLYYTDRINERESDTDNLQHNRLRVANPQSAPDPDPGREDHLGVRALASYCMSELPSKLYYSKE